MRRVLSALSIAVGGVFWLATAGVLAVLVTVMRTDNRHRRRVAALDQLGEIGYDDNDPGIDVDMHRDGAP